LLHASENQKKLNGLGSSGELFSCSGNGSDGDDCDVALKNCVDEYFGCISQGDLDAACTRATGATG
jgi:hypothetical protein